MNRKIELTIYAIIFCLFGVVFVSAKQPTAYVYYSLALWISFGLMIVISRYIISPKLLDKKFGYSFILFAAPCAILFLVTGHLYSQYLAEVFKVESVSYFERLVIKETVPYLMIAAFIGFLHLVDLRKKSIKKSLYYFTAGVVVIIIGFSIKYFVDINYQGDKAIKFIEKDHNNLADLLNERQFSEKVVYIDLWYSSCGPCIADFGKLPEFKKELENQKIEYLYLAHETSHPNSFQLWKNAIKKHHLEGWHVYMNPELEKSVWELIRGNDKVYSEKFLWAAYPHYLIVDRTKIISYSAEGPGSESIDKLKSLMVKESR